jgi:hypothetical protein
MESINETIPATSITASTVTPMSGSVLPALRKR